MSAVCTIHSSKWRNSQKYYGAIRNINSTAITVAMAVKANTTVPSELNKNISFAKFKFNMVISFDYELSMTTTLYTLYIKQMLCQFHNTLNV